MFRILILLFLPILCFGEESQLKNIFNQARKGEFVVASHQKNYTLWNIKDRTDTKLLLEEISVPIKRVSLPENGWQGWINQGAPQHTAWVMYSIDLISGRVLSLFSVDEGCWLSQEMANKFLATLLNIPFYPAPENQRRRIGAKGPLQNTPYWNPPLNYFSQPVYGQDFDQYMTRWPQDGTDLSNKRVEIFVLNSDKYPSFFPYWLQVSGSFGKVSVRVVDTGSNLTTSTSPMWNR